MRWAQITINAIVSAVDVVGNCLNEIGCAGFMIEDECPPTRISGYFPVDDRIELRLEQLDDRLRALASFGVEGVDREITIHFVEEDDWANAWKAFFKPTRVGKRIVITPPWESPPNLPDDVTIIIDPGMAFGTGSHPTTQLCLCAIEDYLSPGMALADIGTGSGILSIAAAKLGASSVSATDIDPLAVNIARRNAEVNGVCLEVSETLPAGTYDLVVANILADVIIGMADDLIAKLASGGKLIVSGIIDTREPDVRDTLLSRGLFHVETRREAEWVALVMERTLSGC